MLIELIKNFTLGMFYIKEYPIAKAYLNSRVQTIYGGTTEIMKEIIGKSLGF